MNIDPIPCHTHETVLSCDDPGTGLQAIIALHDTTLGPAVGGCRMWPYPDRQAALADALRLSKGMTAKAALAGVPFGGGKAVILGDPLRDKTPARLRAFGRFLHSLQGRYITGEDVGMSPADMAVIATETPHVAGLEHGAFASGDPAPVTADLVFRCMVIAARSRLGSHDLRGRRVAVQGLGHVGMALVNRLAAAGARITAADPSPQVANRAATDFAAQIVPPDDLLSADVDILAPCALGGVLGDTLLPRLRAKLICGSANNQLADQGCAARLHGRGVLYCPDFVVNSGGLINVTREVLRIADPAWIRQRLDQAAETFRQLLEQARKEGRPPQHVAETMVADILRAAKAIGPKNATGRT